MAMPVWISEVHEAFFVIGSVATAFVAAAATWIAWRQSLTAGQKLKLDLFPLRVEVYKAVLNGLQTTLNQEEGQLLFDQHTAAMTEKIREARFLFDSETFDWLNEIENDAIKYRIQNRQIRDPSFHISPLYGSVVVENGELAETLLGAMTELAIKLQPSLQLDDKISFSLSKPNV